MRYPAVGAARLQLVEDPRPRPTPPAATIPAQAWKYFEQTAKGQAAQLSVQRIIGGQPRPADDTHGQLLDHAGARQDLLHASTTATATKTKWWPIRARRTPRSSRSAARDGCPVCHTISANGKVFANASRVGYFDNDYRARRRVQRDARRDLERERQRLAFADRRLRGRHVARELHRSAPMIGAALPGHRSPPTESTRSSPTTFGETPRRALVGIDPSTRQVNTGNTMLSGGSGTGLLAQYYPSSDYTGAVWKRIDPQLNFNLTGFARRADWPRLLGQTDWANSGLLQRDLQVRGRQHELGQLHAERRQPRPLAVAVPRHWLRTWR